VQQNRAVKYLKQGDIVTIQLKNDYKRTGLVKVLRFLGIDQIADYTISYAVFSLPEDPSQIVYEKLSNIERFEFTISNKEMTWEARIKRAKEYFFQIGKEDSFWTPILEKGYDETNYQQISNSEHQKFILIDFARSKRFIEEQQNEK